MRQPKYFTVWEPPPLQLVLIMTLMYEHYPMSTWTHACTCGSAVNAIQNGGREPYFSYPDGSSLSLSTPAVELSSNYKIQMHALIIGTEHLNREEGQHNIVLLTDASHFHQDTQTISSKWYHQIKPNGCKLNYPSFPNPKSNPGYIVFADNERYFKCDWKTRNNGYTPDKDCISQFDSRAPHNFPPFHWTLPIDKSPEKDASGGRPPMWTWCWRTDVRTRPANMTILGREWTPDTPLNITLNGLLRRRHISTSHPDYWYNMAKSWLNAEEEEDDDEEEEEREL